MKEIAKRTAAAALAGVMAAGMLTGCGEKKLDGTQIVATVNGTGIEMGVLSLMARQQQAQTDAMYKSFMGSSVAEIWDSEAEDGKTYGEQAVDELMEQLELMYLMKEKAADYGVEVTEEDQEAIAEAAAAFMEANSEETIEAVSVTEDQVKTLLELQTYQNRIYDPIVADVDTEVSDEESQQSAFTYVSVSVSDLEEEEAAAKKEQAQEILDQVKDDPAADMSEIAKGVDESYNALSGTFATYENEESDSSVYPDEVLEVLRSLKEGEVCDELIETENSYYIVRLDQEKDEESTESRKETIINNRKSDLFTETTDKWKEEAEIKVDKKVLKTLTITDSHSFVMPTSAPEEEATDPEDDEAIIVDDEDLTDDKDLEETEKDTSK